MLTEDQVRTWLEEEVGVANVTPVAADGLAWGYGAQMGAIRITFALPEGRPVVHVGAGIHFSDDHQAAFGELPDDGKTALLAHVRTKLASHLPDFDIQATEEPIRIGIQAFVYIDDGTRQLLMDRARQVHHLARAVQFAIQDFFYTNQGIGV